MLRRMKFEKLQRLTMIEKCAGIVRENLNIEIPISKNIDEVIKMLGGKIQEEKFKDGRDSELVLETESQEEIFIIKIKPKVTKITRNFLIACELGHLFLHTNYPEDLQNILDKKTTLSIQKSKYDGDEYSFDPIHFAVNLIMPRSKFSYKVEEYTKDGKVDIEQLAQYFETTLNAIVIRGEQLEEFYYF